MMSTPFENGQFDDALRPFDATPKENRSDSSFYLVTKCCLSIPDLDRGREIASLLAIDERTDCEFINLTIKFHGECGDVESAEAMFKALVAERKWDRFTVGAMMTALLRNERPLDSLTVYDEATENMMTNDVVHLLAVTACSKRQHFERGKAIHSEIAHRFVE